MSPNAALPGSGPQPSEPAQALERDSRAPAPRAPHAAGTGAAPQPTGADALVREAAAAGVTVCFANPGTTEMWLVAGLDRAWPAVRPVLCLHENVAAGAADGYARVARRPAMVLLHLGPGLANGLANLHNARRARSPVLVVVGDMATWHRAADPLLAMPVEQLAGCVSGAVVSLAAASCQQQGGSRSRLEAGGEGRGGQGDGQGAAGALGGAVRRALGATAGQRAGDEVEGGAACVGGNVVTLVVPHDLSWERSDPRVEPAAYVASAAAAAAAAAAVPEGAALQDGGGPGSAAAASGGTPPAPAPAPADAAATAAAAEAFIADCAAALQGAGRGRAALYLGGGALLSRGGALAAAGQVAAATGAALLCENAFAAVDRGGGLPGLARLPYFPQEAAAELRKYDVLVLVDARAPVANFGYEGGPSLLACQSPEAVWELDPAAFAAGGPAWSDAGALLGRLAVQLGAGPGGPKEVTPLLNCGGVFVQARRPPMPAAGRLTAAAMCAIVAALQPEGCVVVDESLTSGSTYWEASKACPPFTHLTLTGGAIGSGPPMALGAALALAEEERGGRGATPGGAAAAAAPGPRRRVINLQADGSAMYSLQALWSQAREQLPVATVVCANSSYAILKVEVARQRVPAPGPAMRALTELAPPVLDWVALAAGMGVRAERAGSVHEFAAALQRALAAPGPYLVQADL